MEQQQKSLVEQAGGNAGRYGGFSFGGQEPYGLNPLAKMEMGTVFPNGATAAVLLTFDVEGHYGNGGGSQEKEIANYERICNRLTKTISPRHSMS